MTLVAEGLELGSEMNIMIEMSDISSPRVESVHAIPAWEQRRPWRLRR